MLLERSRELLPRHEMLDGACDVPVRDGLAGPPPPHPVARHRHVPEKESPPDRRLGAVEVERREPAAGLEDARALADHALVVGHVPQRVACGDGIDGRARVIERRDVANYEPGIAAWRLRARS